MKRSRTLACAAAWFTAVERYPRQLHEMERGEYLVMKRAEHARQRLPRPL